MVCFNEADNTNIKSLGTALTYMDTDTLIGRCRHEGSSSMETQEEFEEDMDYLFDVDFE